MIKRLIFDIDGTLITGVNFKSFVDMALQKYGIYSEENSKKFIEGIGQYESNFNSYNIEDYLNHFSLILNTKLNKDFLDMFFGEVKYAVPDENSKLIETLQQLSANYELVLLSNYFEKSQRNRLNSMKIDEFFKEYYGEKLIKPNKQAYLYACGKHNPSECVMIGDDPILDIRGASQCGLNTILINSKGIDSPVKADIILDKVENLSNEIIESMQKNIDDFEER